MTEVNKSKTCCGGGEDTIVEERPGTAPCCGGSDEVETAAESAAGSGCCGGSAREVAADAASDTVVEAERRSERKGGCGCGSK